MNLARSKTESMFDYTLETFRRIVHPIVSFWRNKKEMIVDLKKLTNISAKNFLGIQKELDYVLTVANNLKKLVLTQNSHLFRNL